LTDRETTLKGRVLGALSFSSRQESVFWALKDVSLELRPGEVLGVVGSNGSGKSTLLRILANIFEPAEGTVEIRGRVHPLLDLTGGFNGDLTGRQNALLYGALYRVPRDQMQEIMPKVIEFSELGAFFDVPIKTYSSGMLARLGFSLATQLKPDILLIDEILAVGDEHFQKKSYFRMMKLIESGSSVVLVSHNMTSVEQTCSRAVFLSAGRIVQDGPPAKVIARYRKDSL
jgi:ABC-2 type transport system ATP-binding protein/lipopolysaccharide transport system ATP-binding protein